MARRESTIRTKGKRSAGTKPGEAPPAPAPRTKSPEDRIADVSDAIDALPVALLRAMEAHIRAERDRRKESAALAAWEEVERLGAIVHRQSRILAGKSRGG